MSRAPRRTTLDRPAGGTALADPTGLEHWVVDPAGSTLQISVTVGFVATVRGRFTDVAGDVRLSPDRRAGDVRVSVDSASLTSGSAHWDDVLQRAGLVDTAANPEIGFVSTALTPDRDGWRLDGVLDTDHATVPVTFALRCLGESADRLRFEAKATVASRDATRLLSRPGVDRMIGRTVGVHLVVEAVPAADWAGA